MEENFNEMEYKPSKGFCNFFDILESFVYAIIAVIIIFTFFARLTIVDGQSMDDTLKHGEYLIVADVFFTYTPDNGDIVVVHGLFEHYNEPIIKRVIATEGQTLKMDYNTNTVYVDGVPLEENYAKYIDRTLFPSLQENRYNENGELIVDANGDPVDFPCYNATEKIFEVTVPEGHIFVMGDNRNHSADSRQNEIGFVPEEYIVGKAVFRLFPFSKMGGLG